MWGETDDDEESVSEDMVSSVAFSPTSTPVLVSTVASVSEAFDSSAFEDRKGGVANNDNKREVGDSGAQLFLIVDTTGVGAELDTTSLSPTRALLLF